MRRLILIFAGVILATYCSASGRTWYILPDSTGDAPTIQAGVDSASAGDTVLVACGTYYDCTHPDPDGLMNCLIMKSGIRLRSETGRADCVTIDAQGQGRVIYCSGVDSTASVEGFTIRGGRWAHLGGGMFCERSSPRIVYCSFTENSAVGAGGLWCEESSPNIRYCSFSDNYGEDGGAVGLVYDSDANLSNCSVTDNVASGGGAGMICYDSSPIITDCLFQRNEVTWEDGGAILMIECAPVIANCVFSGNVADYAGGISLRYSSGTTVNCTFYDNAPMAFYCSHESAGTVIGCTFYRNRGWGGAGGIECAWSSSLSVENTIIALSTSGSGIRCWYGCQVSLTCCDIFGNTGGDWVGCIADQYGINGNFSACPSFCNADDGDLHLCDESPCLPGNHPDGYECGLIGAWGEGCSCGPSETEPTTWGAIKAMYKQQMPD